MPTTHFKAQLRSLVALEFDDKLAASVGVQGTAEILKDGKPFSPQMVKREDAARLGARPRYPDMATGSMIFRLVSRVISVKAQPVLGRIDPRPPQMVPGAAPRAHIVGGLLQWNESFSLYTRSDSPLNALYNSPLGPNPVQPSGAGFTPLPSGPFSLLLGEPVAFRPVATSFKTSFQKAMVWLAPAKYELRVFDRFGIKQGAYKFEIKPDTKKANGRIIVLKIPCRFGGWVDRLEPLLSSLKYLDQQLTLRAQDINMDRGRLGQVSFLLDNMDHFFAPGAQELGTWQTQKAKITTLRGKLDACDVGLDGEIRKAWQARPSRGKSLSLRCDELTQKVLALLAAPHCKADLAVLMDGPRWVAQHQGLSPDRIGMLLAELFHYMYKSGQRAQLWTGFIKPAFARLQTATANDFSKLQSFDDWPRAAASQAITVLGEYIEHWRQQRLEQQRAAATPAALQREALGMAEALIRLSTAGKLQLSSLQFAASFREIQQMVGAGQQLVGFDPSKGSALDWSKINRGMWYARFLAKKFIDEKSLQSTLKKSLQGARVALDEVNQTFRAHLTMRELLAKDKIEGVLRSQLKNTDLSSKQIKKLVYAFKDVDNQLARVFGSETVKQLRQEVDIQKLSAAAERWNSLHSKLRHDVLAEKFEKGVYKPPHWFSGLMMAFHLYCFGSAALDFSKKQGLQRVKVVLDLGSSLVFMLETVMHLRGYSGIMSKLGVPKGSLGAIFRHLGSSTEKLVVQATDELCKTQATMLQGNRWLATFSKVVWIANASFVAMRVIDTVDAYQEGDWLAFSAHLAGAVLLSITLVCPLGLPLSLLIYTLYSAVMFCFRWFYGNAQVHVQQVLRYLRNRHSRLEALFQAALVATNALSWPTLPKSLLSPLDPANSDDRLKLQQQTRVFRISFGTVAAGVKPSRATLDPIATCYETVASQQQSKLLWRENRVFILTNQITQLWEPHLRELQIGSARFKGRKGGGSEVQCFGNWLSLPLDARLEAQLQPGANLETGLQPVGERDEACQRTLGPVSVSLDPGSGGQLNLSLGSPTCYVGPAPIDSLAWKAAGSRELTVEAKQLPAGAVLWLRLHDVPTKHELDAGVRVQIAALQYTMPVLHTQQGSVKQDRFPVVLGAGGKGSFTLPTGLRGPGEKDGVWEVVPVAHSLAALARRTPGFDLLRQSYPLQPCKLKHKVQATKKNLAVAVG